jgi:hypothetical protein
MTQDVRSYPKPQRVKETQLEKAKRYRLNRSKKLIGAKKRAGKVKRRVRVLKLPKIKNLEARLKAVMYPYIKRRDGNTCISCGKKGLQGKNWHAGHYIKAELCNIVTRYDEWNINSQCSNCNLWKRGNTIAYRNAMVDKYGEKAVAELDRKYHAPLPLNFNEREWLLEMIKKYKEV